MQNRMNCRLDSCPGSYICVSLVSVVFAYVCQKALSVLMYVAQALNADLPLLDFLIFSFLPSPLRISV